MEDALALWRDKSTPEYGDGGNTIALPRKSLPAEEKIGKNNN